MEKGGKQASKHRGTPLTAMPFCHAPGSVCNVELVSRKETFMLFGKHNGSLLRQQPKGKTVHRVCFGIHEV